MQIETWDQRKQCETQFVRMSCFTYQLMCLVITVLTSGVVKEMIANALRHKASPMSYGIENKSIPCVEYANFSSAGPVE